MLFLPFIDDDLVYERPEQFGSQLSNIIVFVRDIKEPLYVLETLTGYYLANKPDDSDWVVLPVTNFDAYFGNTSFSRKWLAMILESFMRREKQNFGVCRIILSSVFE